MNEYIRTGGKVLAVFDKLTDIRRNYKGVYSYGDKGVSEGDLRSSTGGQTGRIWDR